MKKLLVIILAAIMVVSGIVPAAAAEPEEAERDFTKYLWEIPGDASDEEFLKLMERNYRIIQAFELLFTEDSYKTYSDIYKKEYKRTKSIEDAHRVEDAQEVLVQKLSVADGVWFLWGENPEDNANGYGWFTGKVGPVVDGEEEGLTEEALDASQIDSFGQAPILIKCLLDDPAAAKGNIILISGGGYSRRSNSGEGYPAIPCFQAMGYNCFLLQRRVEPYSVQDIAMDLQRSVRLVRDAAAKEGWGGQDMIAAAGFSGGGMTILDTVNTAYGNLTPVDEGATAYIPDEIDQINSDMDVVMIAYGSLPNPVTQDNLNLPAFYITHGEFDDTVSPENAQIVYDSVKDRVPAVLYMVPDAKHGYGVGVASNAAEGCKEWPIQADQFMMEHKGFSTNRGE